MTTNHVPELPEELKAEDLMSDDFWRSYGIEPVYLDPNNENSSKAAGNNHTLMQQSDGRRNEPTTNSLVDPSSAAHRHYCTL